LARHHRVLHTHLHRDLRIVVDGRRIETAETFAVDWALLKGDRVYEGDGATNDSSTSMEQMCSRSPMGPSSRSRTASQTRPEQGDNPETLSDFGGNEVMLEDRPQGLRGLRAPAAGKSAGEGWRHREGRRASGQDREHRPVSRPHLHFGLLNRPDMFIGRSLPFVIDSYTLAGTVDFKASQGDTLAVISNSKQVRSVYPLHGTVQNFP